VPTVLADAARDRARTALERVVGPRAAHSLLSSSSLSYLSPRSFAQTMAMRVRASTEHHQMPITLVCGSGVVVAVWRGSLAAVSAVSSLSGSDAAAVAVDAVTEMGLLGLSISLVVVGVWHGLNP